MSERYARLFSLPENSIDSGAPVIVLAGALLLDKSKDKVLAQVKFKNISEKTIKAVSVNIFPSDTAGRSLGDPIKFTYLDLNESRDSEWGDRKPLYLPDPSTRQFSLNLEEVVFSDNTVWSPTDTEKEEYKKPEHEEEARTVGTETKVLSDKGKSKKKKTIIAASVTLFIVAAILVLALVVPSVKYNKGLAMIDNGEYDAAIILFESLKNYKDSTSQMERAKREKMLSTGFSISSWTIVQQDDYSKLYECNIKADFSDAFIAVLSNGTTNDYVFAYVENGTGKAQGIEYDDKTPKNFKPYAMIFPVQENLDIAVQADEPKYNDYKYLEETSLSQSLSFSSQNESTGILVYDIQSSPDIITDLNRFSVFYDNKGVGSIYIDSLKLNSRPSASAIPRGFVRSENVEQNEYKVTSPYSVSREKQKSYTIFRGEETLSFSSLADGLVLYRRELLASGDKDSIVGQMANYYAFLQGGQCKFVTTDYYWDEDDDISVYPDYSFEIIGYIPMYTLSSTIKTTAVEPPQAASSSSKKDIYFDEEKSILTPESVCENVTLESKEDGIYHFLLDPDEDSALAQARAYMLYMSDQGYHFESADGSNHMIAFTKNGINRAVMYLSSDKGKNYMSFSWLD